MVLAMVVAWYANISLRPGAVMCPGSALFAGDTIQSIGSDSSLPYRRVPCAHAPQDCQAASLGSLALRATAEQKEQ